MTPAVDDPDFTLHVGDVRDILPQLPAESVHCVVTSPPYWGLRDYGTDTWEGGNADCDHQRRKDPPGRTAARARERVLERARERGYVPTSNFANYEDGYQASVYYRERCDRCGARRVDRQLGLEPTPDEYVASMVAVFREVRRVLRKDGTCWINIGDSYIAGQGGQRTNEPRDRDDVPGAWATRDVTANLKPKDLAGIPWALAFALRADGWWLRAEIIWAKPNPMPESVSDRPTKAHEQVFLLARSPRYFYDADAIREPAAWERWGDQTNGKHEGTGSAAGWIGDKSKRQLQGGRQARRYSAEDFKTTDERNTRFQGPSLESGRNARSVWEIATEPYPDAHFATFPTELARRCIIAGTSEHGCCPECGAPWKRQIERRAYGDWGRRTSYVADQPDGLRDENYYKNYEAPTTAGWRPTCAHDAPPVPCTVLDPFIGSGTVAHVARHHGRRTIGIELSADYAELAVRRTQQLSLLA